MVALGDYYLCGHSSGHAIAFDFYTCAAATLDPDDGANFTLSVFYQHARGVTEDPLKAAACFSHEAEAGHVDAMNALADCLERGYGVELDVEEATKWCVLAGEFDDEDADGDGDGGADGGDRGVWHAACCAAFRRRSAFDSVAYR